MSEQLPKDKKLRSKIYLCRVVHHRYLPKPHHLSYNNFLFYLDLNEIDSLSEQLLFFSHNRFNLFSFYDSDYIPVKKQTLIDNVKDFLTLHHIPTENIKIELLAFVRTCGTIFNPVNFYFIKDALNVPICSIAEVGNTFGEKKLFLLTKENLNNDIYKKIEKKYFYVSPFLEPTDDFEFTLKIPEDALELKVNTYRNDQLILAASLIGKSENLTDWNLLLCAIRFPWITLQVVLQIHWNALLLYLKKISYHRKNENLADQRNIIERNIVK